LKEPPVPHYFLHLGDSIDDVLDMPAEAVAGVALMAARDCMAGDVKAGRLDLKCRIDVHDESGRIVHTLPFADAVEVVDHSVN
jgi:hypothetical protein